VRSFPGGARSCYTLRSLEAGLKYLLRATFMYGNYDGLRRPPVFDLHVGVNFWTTVNVTEADNPVIPEAIVLVLGDSVQVCLVNTGSGTPFISGLDLRPLKSTLYPQANETQGLVLVGRMNFGPTEITDIVRYVREQKTLLCWSITMIAKTPITLSESSTKTIDWPGTLTIRTTDSGTHLWTPPTGARYPRPRGCRTWTRTCSRRRRR
jgi:hypothetical protein